MSQAISPAFAVAIVAAVNKPGDAIPPLASLSDPFEIGVTWTLPNGVPARNGVSTGAPLSGRTVVELYVNTSSVWVKLSGGVYRYWSRTSTPPGWQWDANHGPDGGYF